MDAAVKDVMDGLFRGNITFQDAVERLRISEEELHGMIDKYEYLSTTEDILDANMIMLDNLEYIEREISISHERRTQSKFNPSSAAGGLETVVIEPAISSVADVIYMTKPKEPTIPTAGTPYCPYDHGYIG
ncbi:MAG: hypothetical protein Q8M95_10080 [Candidatus Methanoperedens sp.]|nr:hypothetical protein [Candidatus Methanoperedens sp.]